MPTEGDTTATACGSYSWHGYTNLTESGDYTDVLTNAAGCDSVVTLHLTINVPTEGDTTATACGSYSWHGYTNLTESGDYTDVLTNVAGCDSVVILHLTVNHPTVTVPFEVTICESELPYHYENGDIDTTFDVGTPNLSIFSFQFSTQYGCDSTVILTVNIATATESDTTATACGSFSWHGYTNLTESGNYTDVLTNVAGCDSVVTLHLTINVPTEGDTTATACGSFSWHGYANLTESGDYTDVLTNAAGCDSTVTLHLTINTPTEGDTTATACGSFNWHGYTNLTESGDYTDVLTNAAGCDSTVTLHLTVNPLPEVTISGETAFCEGGNTTLTASGATTYTWGNETTAELTVDAAGTYTVTGTDANGCENTTSVEVTVNALPTVTISGETSFCEGGSTILTASGAESYEWSTMEFGAEFEVTEAGAYTVIGTDANGCTGTASVEVIVHFAVTEPVEVTICENDLPYHYVNGDIDTTFDVGTPNLLTIPYTLTTIYGCDSTVILTLTVEPCDTVGITEHVTADISLYPNPTTGIVNVQYSMNNAQSGDVEIRVYDVYGKLIETTHALSPQSTVQIDLSNYATGIYIVKYVNGGKVVAVKKVVKE